MDLEAQRVVDEEDESKPKYYDDDEEQMEEEEEDDDEEVDNWQRVVCAGLALVTVAFLASKLGGTIVGLCMLGFGFFTVIVLVFVPSIRYSDDVENESENVQDFKEALYIHLLWSTYGFFAGALMIFVSLFVVYVSGLPYYLATDVSSMMTWHD